MSTPTLPFTPSSMPLAARGLFALLSRIDEGALEVTLPDGTMRVYGPGRGMHAVLNVRDLGFARDVLTRGDVGFGESYMRGAWDSPDLAGLLTLLAANQPALTGAFYGSALVRAVLRLRHRRRANTRPQARRNIVAHYDLGNDFYAAWLDPTMTYSSALFDGNAEQPLACAQQAKYERMLRELAVPQGSRILEIGCGWGGFAVTAARAGHDVTGISLSDAQTAYARERAAREAAPGRVELAIMDYRDVRGRFDAVASIEMFEAVGERWWPTYFDTLRNVLAPGGRACVQAITIAGDRFERYRASSDFIQQHIFPGGMLASRSRLVAEAARAGLELVALHAFGRDYARTLKRWLAAFDLASPSLRAKGFDDAFLRCWRFYLAYCAAGFDTATTDVGQYTFVRR
jgi:cyclopropane-fatty-acyl-phospholipid synthase